ncbi:MAG: hypothetical protein NDJ89_16515 [Oligoflexia bacterium]|nr:hypothetical protein [Oligoflexia bacterium]
MRTLLPVALLAISCLTASCASGPAVRTQSYAALNPQRTFEYELPVVWKGIEKALSGYKIESRSPSEVEEQDLRQLASREIETDWMIGQSRDKYHEYQVNGSPRKINLQTRFKFRVVAERRIGGTDVKVELSEEIERLKADGTPAGYEGADVPDSSRSSELLEKIRLAILSAAP